MGVGRPATPRASCADRLLHRRFHMRKVLFIPFSRMACGNLANSLKWDPSTKKGIPDSDRIYGRRGSGDYNERSLEKIENGDQLYITGHCLKGKDYLSTTAA